MHAYIFILFNMCGLPLRSSSKEVVFLNTNPPKTRSRLLKSAKKLTSLGDDCVQIFQSNVIDRFASRPRTQLYEEMSLYDFAAKYKKTLNCSGKLPRYELLNDAGIIMEGSKSAIIRTPRFTPEINGDIYYYSLLLLHLPWRKEL